MVELDLGFPARMELVNYPGYSVDSGGNVWSIKSGTYKKLSPQNCNGYQLVMLYVSRPTPRYVHRLVCEAYHGVSMREVDHVNSDKADNRLVNLEYVSRSENMRRRWQNDI